MWSKIQSESKPTLISRTLPHAISLHHLWWRKKKVEQFIIPPTYFRRTDYSIVETKQVADSRTQSAEGSHDSYREKKAEVAEPKVEISNSELIVSAETTPESHARTGEANPKPQTTNLAEGPKFSALSLSSIRAKRELLESTRGIVKEDVHLPTEAFNETDMLLQWSKYAQRLGDRGHKIMESLLLIGDPKLEGTKITHELPNDSTKIEFESEKLELLGYLRGKLHNHDITIDVVVNEKVENKFTFTPIDKFNRLNEINPNLELLKKTFDLDI